MITEAVIKGFGEGMGQGIVSAVLIVLIGILVVIAATVLLGAVFFVLSYVFYKRKKKKTFLVFGILGSLFSSLGLGVVLSSFLMHDISNIKWMAPVFFVLGMVLIIRKYKKII